MPSYTVRIAVLAVLSFSLGCSSSDDELKPIVERPPPEPSEHDDEAGCRIDGTFYASGTRAPDPISCNDCTCSDGRLVECTEIACRRPCPDGTAYGETCSATGPADECREMTLGCLPSCTRDAQCAVDRECREGLCKHFRTP